jgi:hypothetical protein
MNAKDMSISELLNRYELALQQRKQGYKLRLGREFIRTANDLERTFRYELAERGVSIA